MKITNTEKIYCEALLLARTAPTKEYKDLCVAHAESIGKELTDHQKGLASYGVETAIELNYLLDRKKMENSKREAIWKI